MLISNPANYKKIPVTGFPSKFFRPLAPKCIYPRYHSLPSLRRNCVNMADSTVETLPKDAGFKPKRHSRSLQENTFRKFAEEDNHFESSSLLYYMLVTVALVSFEVGLLWFLDG